MKYDSILERRLWNAVKASRDARNPAFKAFWNKVFDQLVLNAD